MLFELLQQRGDRAGFDSLTIEYAAFRKLTASMDRLPGRARSGSAWCRRGALCSTASAPIIVLPEAIDGGVVRISSS